MMSKGREVVLIVAGGVVGGLLSAIDAWAQPISYPLTGLKPAALVLIPALKGE